MSNPNRFFRPSSLVLLFVTGFLPLIPCSAQPLANGDVAAGIQTIQLRPNIYVLIGAGENVILQVGDDGAAVIGAGRSAASTALLTAIKKLTDAPIRFVIDTSADAEAVGGNGVLAKAGRSIYFMVTPAKGDYVGIPLTVEAARIADAWDPAKDTANGQACKSYGAAAIMIRPERLHMTWQDKKTLVMEVDAGTQKRIFHFGGHVDPTIEASWQGYSSAAWISRTTPGFVRAPVDAQYLHVTTTRMLPGYLRQNGIPYSGNATLTEDYDLDQVSDEEVYLIVTNTVSDPVDLDYPLILTAIFQKQFSDAGWHPTTCSSLW